LSVTVKCHHVTYHRRFLAAAATKPNGNDFVFNGTSLVRLGHACFRWTWALSILHYEDYINMGDNSAPKPHRAKNRKPRGHGLRTRTGCITCRKRHLKCDEQKPTCNLCTKSGRTCVYSERPNTQSGSAEAVTPRQASAEGEASEPQSSTTTQPTQQVSQYVQDHTSWACGSQDQQDVRQGSTTAALSAKTSFTNSPENPYARPFLPDNPPYHSGPSPESVSSRGLMPDVAIAEWYLLLAGDASIEDSGFLRAERGNVYDAHALQSPNGQTLRRISTSLWAGENFQGLSGEEEAVRRATYHPRDDATGQEGAPAPENRPWQSSEPLTLLDHENFIFQNFVKRIALWV
jgi:hypothetical protein